MTNASRRDILEGAVAGAAVAATYSAAGTIGQFIPEPAAKAAPLTQAEIARNVRALAGEQSLLLGELVEGDGSFESRHLFTGVRCTPLIRSIFRRKLDWGAASRGCALRSTSFGSAPSGTKMTLRSRSLSSLMTTGTARGK